MHTSRNIAFGATGFMVAAVLLSAGAGTAWASGHGSSGAGGANQPAGNNGTVKIDEYSMDPGQDNDPHVTCGFSVNFYGYDGGAQTASIDLTPVAPTAASRTYHTATGWDVGTRSGGNQLDKSVPISASDLTSTLAGVTPQAHQGYHLRLEVEVTGSRGSDDKYKVFWMQPCAAASPSSGTAAGIRGNQDTTETGTPVSGSAADTSSGTATSGTATTDRGVAALASQDSVSAPVARIATVAPAATVSSARPATASPSDSASGTQASSRVVPVATAAAQSGSLAFTGANVAGLVAAGLALIGAGLLLTIRWRRMAHRYH